MADDKSNIDAKPRPSRQQKGEYREFLEFEPGRQREPRVDISCG